MKKPILIFTGILTFAFVLFISAFTLFSYNNKTLVNKNNVLGVQTNTLNNTKPSDKIVITESINTRQIVSTSIPKPPTPTPIPQPTFTPTPKPAPTAIPRVLPTSTPVPIYTACHGRTALCVDGTCSDSAHRQGTCSHHGGVAQWYP